MRRQEGSMSRCQSALATAALLAVVASRTAHAGDRIVIEARGADQADAAALASVEAELGTRGLERGAALAAEIDARISRDGGALATGQVVEAQKDVDAAYARFIDGDYPKALASARSALDTYAKAFGQLAREPALRELRYKALVVAARSAEVNGAGEDAFSSMAEVIRSFPDRPIASSQFDPSVSALYHRVKQELATQGTGSLEVKVDDPAATIFVDEQFVASGSAKLDKLAPGRYRVYVAKGQAPGRLREVEIASGASVTVEVSWLIEGALRTSADGVTLALDAGAAADAEVQVATRLGRVLGARTVVVLSVRAINGRRAIAGYAISVESQTRTFAAVQLEPVAPSAEKLASLAALLAGDKGAPSTGLITTEPVELPPAPVAAPLGARKKVALALGAVALGSLIAAGGFELSSRDTYDQSKVEPDATTQDALYDSANKKYKFAQAFALGGAALAVGAAVLWLTGGASAESEQRVSLLPAVGPDGASLVVTGRF
jgi:hypothetical protein